jgi:mannose-6-phosphate isomerase-like protein (cupin superfamily)
MGQEEVSAPVEGDGYAVASLDGLGEGYGFRKIRKELGVTAFGANAIVLPPNYETGHHAHERQEELYFVHSGRIEIEFGDGSKHTLGPGGMAWVAPQTFRGIRNFGPEAATYVVVGAADGYVGRDGIAREDQDPEVSKRGQPIPEGTRPDA